MDKKQDCAFVCLRCWTNNCLPSVFCLLAWGVNVVRRFLFHFHTVFLSALSESMLSTCFDFDSKFSNHCSIWTNIVQMEQGIMETMLFGQWRHASFKQTPIVPHETWTFLGINNPEGFSTWAPLNRANGFSYENCRNHQSPLNLKKKNRNSLLQSY